MANHREFSSTNKGFTLIEVLVVIVVIGLMVAAVQFSFNSNKPETVLQQESARFAGIFDLAAQYGLLNSIEIGLIANDTSYQFVGYDGTQWIEINEVEALALYQLPEYMTLVLSFDDLSTDEPSLISRELFEVEDQDDFTIKDDDEKPIIPQVYILSGGDITPFTLTFAWQPLAQLSEDISYQVVGEYTTPVVVKGPIVDGVYHERQ